MAEPETRKTEPRGQLVQASFRFETRKCDYCTRGVLGPDDDQCPACLMARCPYCGTFVPDECEHLVLDVADGELRVCAFDEDWDEPAEEVTDLLVDAKRCRECFGDLAEMVEETLNGFGSLPFHGLAEQIVESGRVDVHRVRAFFDNEPCSTGGASYFAKDPEAAKAAFDAALEQLRRGLELIVIRDQEARRHPPARVVGTISPCTRTPESDA